MEFRRNIDNMCVWVCTCMCVRIDIRWMCTVFSLYVRVCYHVCWDVICVFLMYFYELLSIRVCFCAYFWKYSIIIQIHVEFMKYIKKNIRSWLIHIQYSHFYLFFFTFFIVANIPSKVITILCFVWRIYYHHNSVLYTNVFFFSIKQNGNPNHTDIDRGFTHFDIRS